jgi:hypothetical protein
MTTPRPPICLPCVLGGAAVVVLAAAGVWQIVDKLRR